MKQKVKWKELGKQLWEMCRALARVGREATAKQAEASFITGVTLPVDGGFVCYSDV